MNILILHTDEHLQQFLGVMGHPLVRTPNIDRLARDGATVFDNAYTCNGVCVPSRACLMTGRYPIAHGVVNNSIRLPSHEQTMGKLFSSAGYATGYFGKTHFGGDDTDMPGQGWQDSFIWHRQYDDWLHAQGIEQTYPEGEHIDSKTRYWTIGTSNIPCEFYFENVMGDRSVEFIRRHADDPWLCIYGAIAPHGPFTPPEPYASMVDPEEVELLPRFETELEDKPPAFVKWIEQNRKYVTERELKIYLAHLFGLITMVDDNVGKLVGALKELDLYDRTMIVFTSDHGDFSTRFGVLGKSWNQLDCVMKTPLVVRLPGAAGPDRSEALVQNIDLLPTMCEAAGVEVPPKVQGRSLVELLRGEVDHVHEAVYAYDQSEYGGGLLGMSMVRTGRYKYIESSGFGGELYDMQEDPWEVCNLAEAPAYAETVRQMKDRLLQWHVGCTGGYFDPRTARFWEDEVAFYDETRFCGRRIVKKSDDPT